MTSTGGLHPWLARVQGLSSNKPFLSGVGGSGMALASDGSVALLSGAPATATAPASAFLFSFYTSANQYNQCPQQISVRPRPWPLPAPDSGVANKTHPGRAATSVQASEQSRGAKLAQPTTSRTTGHFEQQKGAGVVSGLETPYCGSAMCCQAACTSLLCWPGGCVGMGLRSDHGLQDPYPLSGLKWGASYAISGDASVVLVGAPGQVISGALSNGADRAIDGKVSPASSV